MEGMRSVAKCHLEDRILRFSKGHPIVPEGADDYHGAQRSADRDRQQDRVHEQADKERHNERAVVKRTLQVRWYGTRTGSKQQEGS